VATGTSNELDRFLQDPVENIKDPLEWWFKNHTVSPDPSAYYSRYHWWEIIAYNIDITGQANLGRNIQYYWDGPKLY
jgi:hypothetical protein